MSSADMCFTQCVGLFEHIAPTLATHKAKLHSVIHVEVFASMQSKITHAAQHACWVVPEPMELAAIVCKLYTRL